MPNTGNPQQDALPDPGRHSDSGVDSKEFWGALVACLLHPTQLEIIEALRWIDEPVSASDLVQVFDGKEFLGTLSRHVRALAKLGALNLARERQAKGSIEKGYRLEPRPTTYRTMKKRGEDR